MITRDDHGRQVWTLEENEEELGMTITNGAVYRFRGDDYLATLEDSELSGDTVASFQRLPINQEDDEPSLFLERLDGSLCDDAGTNLGDYRDLERIED